MQKALMAGEIKLKNGMSMPQLGLGTWPMREASAVQAVRQALELGYRLIDTAEAYENEEAVGKGIQQSHVAREEIFVTTKFNKQWHSRSGVRKACEASLKRLRLEYVDLFLIHWPNPQQDHYVEAFEGMMDLIDAGLIRAAGVSNFKQAHLECLFSAGLFPQVNQIQLDPYRQRAEEVAFHRQHGIVVESWSPLDRDGGLLEEAVVLRVAEELKRSPAQVVLRWHVQKGFVTVPKSADRSRQRSNLDIFDFALSEKQMQYLDTLTSATAVVMDSDSIGH